jgi:hypothetical protein
MQPTYVIGDIHGQYEKFVRLLRESGLVGSELDWTGADARLVLIGDFFDRGPGGVAAVDLVMRLQQQSAQEGGTVRALMGNHELLLLAALRFSEYRTQGPGGTFFKDWVRNGGVRRDLERVSEAHVEWILNLPVMTRLSNRLFIHADGMFYLNFGRSVQEVNENVAEMLKSDTPQVWERLLIHFSERQAFVRDKNAAREINRVFQSYQIVHGHTPISILTGQLPQDVTRPFIYADGLCINVDGGMYAGGPGFIYLLQDMVLEPEPENAGD